MVDGSVIPTTPITAWTTGQFNHMPVMGGNVQDEGNFGIGNTEYFTGPPQVPITADQYVANRLAIAGRGAPPIFCPCTRLVDFRTDFDGTAGHYIA
jgi:para-nitrobenzyl esterase